jgi:hypothetical protein
MSKQYVDAVNGILIGQPGGVGLSLVPGLVGNALQCTQRIAIETGDNISDLKFSPEWTIALWAKADPPSSNGSGFYMDWICNDADVICEVIIQCVFQTAFGGEGYLEIDQFVGDDETSDTAGGALSGADGNWRFMLFESNAGQINYRVNDGSLHNLCPSLVYPVTATGAFIINTATIGGAFSQTHSFDEIAIFPQALTPTQHLALYNSGAGVTWPIDL